MIFEDALAEMRDGKAITHPLLEEDVYYIACTIELCGEVMNARSIAKMQGSKMHPDMLPAFGSPVPYPHICIFQLMCDKWEVFDHKKRYEF